MKYVMIRKFMDALFKERPVFAEVAGAPALRRYLENFGNDEGAAAGTQLRLLRPGVVRRGEAWPHGGHAFAEHPCDVGSIGSESGCGNQSDVSCRTDRSIDPAVRGSERRKPAM